jgi:CRISPR-associated exonuclease Cas4
VERPENADLEDALVPLSALQHYLFCPRQCALIHVEQSWAEDGATAEGRLLHERTDAGKPDRRQGIKILRSLTIRSFTIGVTGKADVVEMHGTQPYPVEYKRGRPKTHRADEVQLCAQAICLEDMFVTPVPEGALFYGETRRRTIVAFDAELRALTAQVAADTRQMIAAQKTPPPVFMPACKNCSMQDICRPHRLEKPPHIANWLVSQISA